MAIAFAVIGVYQYATRDVFWNPKVIVGNAYAPFYRVNSVFYDPSVYGRFLVVAILAALVIALYDRDRRAGVRGRRARSCVIWVGLLFSFSQSSFAALIVGTAVVAAFRWRWRAAARARHRVGRDRRRRARDAAHPPLAAARVRLRPEQGLERPREARHAGDQDRRSTTRSQGVGIGGFKRAYANRVGLRGKEPKKAASHNTAVTVSRGDAACPASRCSCWLVGAALFVTLRRATGVVPGARVPRLRCRPRRDRAARAVLQRALRGSGVLGAARADGALLGDAGAPLEAGYRDRRAGGAAAVRAAKKVTA